MLKKYKVAPLSGGYMAVSIIGFLASILYVYEENRSWGVAFALVFATMFFSSVASMTSADPMEFIELEEKKKKKRKS